MIARIMKPIPPAQGLSTDGECTMASPAPTLIDPVGSPRNTERTILDVAS